MKEAHTVYGRAFYGVLGLVTAVLGIAGLVLARGGTSGWAVILMVLWSALGLLLLVRSVRMGLAFDDHTLEVRGALRTRAFDRSRASLLMDDTPVGLSVPRVGGGGRLHPVYGMTGWNTAKDKDEVLELLEANGLLRRRT